MNSNMLNPGDVIGKYIIEKELGRGNNGVVYLARQRVLDRLVACKILLPEAMSAPGYTEAFFREARTAALLSHPNVVQALDVGIENGNCFFIMEYVDGIMLEDIRKNTPEQLTPKFLLNAAIQLAGALEYAWNSRKIIHGDIKPENILIKHSDQSAKLADLGVARVVGSQNNDEIMATPLYVAPEVITQNNFTDPRSDIYSFGIMMYELCCGEPPFDGNMEDLLNKHIYEIPRPLLQRNPDMNVQMANLVDRMIAKSPENRPASWCEVKETLITIMQTLEKESASAHAETLKEENPEEQSKSFPGWLKMLIAIAAAITACFIFIFFARIFVDLSTSYQ